MSNNYWEGSKVRLRALEPGDADTFFEWNLDSEVSRNLYQVHFPQSRESVGRWAHDVSVRGPEGDSFFWVIESLDGEVVGSINAHQCDRRNGTFKYGIAVKREHWRKGYASEAIRLVIRYYFEELGYQKVNAEVYEFNEPSIRLHEGLGFVLEGRLRQMIYTESKHFDLLVYGTTKEEF